MKKRLLALLLCTAMLLVVISGCGGTANSAASAEEPAPAESAETPNAPEAAPEAAAPAGEADSAPIEYQPLMTEETAAIIQEAAEAANARSAADVPDEEKSALWKFVESEDYQSKLNELRAEVDKVLPGSETRYDAEGNILSVNDVVYDYPVEDGHSISIFAPVRGMISRSVNDYAELLSFKIAAAETNIDVDFTTISEDSAETQMSLMFASGDFTDVVSDFVYDYAGTNVSAYENDLIIPINDYLEEYSPNYYAWLNSNPDYLKAVSSDDGLIFEWCNIMPDQRSESTSWVRTDLLEKFGIDSPVTIEEYEDYFERCVDAGLTATIYADTTTWSAIASNAFDLPALNGAESFGLAAYHIDDTIYSAYQSEDLREFIELMRSWYEKGFFSKDLVSFNGQGADRQAQDQLVVTGEVGYMMQGVDRYTNYKSSASVEGWDIEPARSICMSEDQILHFAINDVTSQANGSIVITTACEDIEGACRYLDWFYTDMGIETMNYGPEGVTWNWSEDGQTRQFTSAVYDDQVFGEDAGSAIMFYTGYVAWTSVTDPYAGMYYAETDKGITATEIYDEWNDSAYYLNDNWLSFTTDESDIIEKDLADLTTFISENVVKFLVGDKSMDEWDSFINTLSDQLGLQTIVDTYQAAYDRYIAR